MNAAHSMHTMRLIRRRRPRVLVLIGAALRGKGRGDLAYLGGYMFRIRSSHSIDVGPIGETCASVTLYFKQNYSLPLSQRPSMSFDVEPHTASASPAH
jgi:hypothetical protein